MATKSLPIEHGRAPRPQGWKGTLSALGVASAAMIALHLVQAELDPVAQPVSYYVHGRHGWLLSVALVASAVAAFLLSRAAGLVGWTRRSLLGFGLAMLLAGLIPSDRWFPWEREPTLSGLVHGALALVGPLALLPPMIVSLRAESGRKPSLLRISVLGYVVALASSGASLIAGFSLDRAPPMIGVAERLLTCAAVAWVGVTAWNTRSRAR